MWIGCIVCYSYESNRFSRPKGWKHFGRCSIRTLSFCCTVSNTQSSCYFRMPMKTPFRRTLPNSRWWFTGTTCQRVQTSALFGRMQGFDCIETFRRLALYWLDWRMQSTLNIQSNSNTLLRWSRNCSWNTILIKKKQTVNCYCYNCHMWLLLFVNYFVRFPLLEKFRFTFFFGVQLYCMPGFSGVQLRLVLL